MKSLQIRKLAMAAAAASACVMSSGAALANEAIFGDVTIGLNAGAGNTLILSFDNVASSTGTWANAVTLANISLAHTGAASLALAGWSRNGLELGSNGCTGGGSGKDCFSGSSAVSDDMDFTFTYTGTLNLDGLGDAAPQLKVRFLDASGAKTGSLYSAAVPVPEPETYALMLAGLAAVGFMARRRRQS
jgi:PEP-CTERM motif